MFYASGYTDSTDFPAMRGHFRPGGARSCLVTKKEGKIMRLIQLLVYLLIFLPSQCVMFAQGTPYAAGEFRRFVFDSTGKSAGLSINIAHALPDRTGRRICVGLVPCAHGGLFYRRGSSYSQSGPQYPKFRHSCDSHLQTGDCF